MDEISESIKRTNSQVQSKTMDNSLATSLSIRRKQLFGTQFSPIQSVGLSCLSVRKVYCGKTADWIRMPFGILSGVSRGMVELDGVMIVEGKGAVLG